MDGSVRGLNASEADLRRIRDGIRGHAIESDGGARALVNWDRSWGWRGVDIRKIIGLRLYRLGF